MFILPFQQILLSEPERATLARNLKEVTASSGRIHNIGYEKDGTLNGVRLEGVVMLFIYQQFTRPLQWELVGVVPGRSKILLPKTYADDFNEMRHLLEVKSLTDMILLYLLCRRSYSVYDKGEHPVNITPGSPLLDDIPLKQRPAISHDTTLWWLKWGGILYEVIYNAEVFSVRQIARSIGDFFPLPSSLRR